MKKLMIGLATAISVSALLLATACDSSKELSSKESGRTKLVSEEPTDPPIGNSYGIYVSGNTKLAKLAGNTLIDKCTCPWSDSCYGYVLTNGCTFTNGAFNTYSDISVSVNEDPSYPYTGTILLKATRTTDGVQYPLKVTYDWKAVDYGDYYNFTWSNEQIYG